MRGHCLLSAVSIIGLGLASSSGAQTTPSPPLPSAGRPAVPAGETPVPQAAVPPAATTFPNDRAADAGPPADQQGDIVVTGVRSSLERAAEIKRDAVQVVDAIVAQDIGKFPDPTTAAALQRVPGVQVQNNNNNELSGVRIRGLTDILTTVDQREVFTTTGRNFDLQDLPAEALARVNVYKSQTADLIEGGVAGGIDLRLNKPFNFRKPTLVVSARGNYGIQSEELNPQLGVLATARADTGIGEVGALIGATYSYTDSLRTATSLTDQRDSAAAPLSSPGYFVPNVLQNVTTNATLKRTQVNAALQWQATDSIEAYVDGLYTRFENEANDVGFNVQPQTTLTTLTGVVPNQNCFQVRSTTGAAVPGTTTVVAAGQNPAIVTVNGRQVLQPFAVKTLCGVDRITFLNAVANQTTGAQTLDQNNKLIAGGLRFDNKAGSRATLDVGYQTSSADTANVRTAVGQRVATLTLNTDADGGPTLTVPGDALVRTDALSLRNQLIQTFNLAKGSLFQARVDGEQELGGFIAKVEAGLRYVDRSATFVGVQLNTPLPFGNIGTASEARARLVSQTGLPASFLALSDIEPRVNGGARFYGPSAEFLRNDGTLDLLRTVYGLPHGRPRFDPLRQFDAAEKTYASYVQANYRLDIASDVTLDGVVGVRVTRTDRDLATFSAPGVQVGNDRSDTDVLPSATARLKLPASFQARFAFSKAIRRPEFASLNPALNLIIDVNPAVLSTGSSGNPDLRPQKSDSFDVTIEHYWTSGFVALTGYYRTITDRVITSPSQQVINGRTFVINSPRNVGRAKLQGLEASGQYFLDFLPGALAGFGTLGAFTYADSEVGGSDPLRGTPLQGVSKYNFTAGALYDKYGLSGRVVYTYRSRYIQSDITGAVQLRAFDPARVNDVYVPVLLEYVRPMGRLDFSLGYDLTDRVRLDVGGTNILRTPTRTYRGETFFPGNYNDDETTYTAGIRIRI